MKKLLIYLIANALALYGISYLLNGNFTVTGGWIGYGVAAAIIGLVNALVKPILKLLSLPFLLMTAGLFSIVLNILMLALARYLLNNIVIIEGVHIEISTLITYVWAALLLSLANMVIHWIPVK